MDDRNITAGLLPQTSGNPKWTFTLLQAAGGQTCCLRCSTHSFDWRGGALPSPILDHDLPGTGTRTWSYPASVASSFQNRKTNTTPTSTDQTGHEAIFVKDLLNTQDVNRIITHAGSSRTVGMLISGICEFVCVSVCLCIHAPFIVKVCQCTIVDVRRIVHWITSAPGHVIIVWGSAVPESDCTFTNSPIDDKDNQSVVFDGAVHVHPCSKRNTAWAINTKLSTQLHIYSTTVVWHALTCRSKGQNHVVTKIVMVTWLLAM